MKFPIQQLQILIICVQREQDTSRKVERMGTASTEAPDEQIYTLFPCSGLGESSKISAEISMEN